MKCLGCKKNDARKKWCSKKCNQDFLNKKHRKTHNDKARQRLVDDPVGERKKRAEAARKWRAKHPDKSRAINRGRLNTGKMETEDTVLFYGYKEPLRKFEGGYGYQGVLSYSKDHDKVQCHLCGLLFRTLNNGHLMGVHSLTASEYKEKTGLSSSTALVGEGTRLKLIERGHNPNHMEELKKAQEKRRERKRKGLKDMQSGAKLSLERKNQRGTCPDQLLAIIDRTIKSYGRVPTEKEFLRFHNGKYMGSIRNTYGTWTNALSKLGKRPNAVKYTSEELLEAVRNFYQVHKRTPRWSDFEQRGLLPSTGPYYARFKSLNNVRLSAGVPLVIPCGYKKSEEWMPTPAEREKMLQKT